MHHRPQTIITLTTDFGLNDEYVGVVKGVLAAQAPDAKVIDLCHTVPAFNIRKGAFLIESAYRYFPPQTIHLLVIDPGVGSQRPILIVQANEHLFVAPDNGVISYILQQNRDGIIFQVTDTSLFQPKSCSTFHGRDIFAPITAYLARGGRPEEIAVKKTSATHLPHLSPLVDHREKTLSGSILDIDHFGNITISMKAQHLNELSPEPFFFTLSPLGDQAWTMSSCYSDVAMGEVVVLINSRNYLEIAVNMGNAAQIFGLKMGDAVLLKKQR